MAVFGSKSGKSPPTSRLFTSQKHSSGMRGDGPLRACGAPCRLLAILASAAASSSWQPPSTTGGIYSDQFLRGVASLHSPVMGVENMAPLLYTITRFLKPKSVLEVGAGYTTMFLLQALKDNHHELTAFAALNLEDQCTVTAFGDHQLDWCAQPIFERPWSSALHCVDAHTHQHSTAARVEQAAAQLGLSSFLHLRHGVIMEQAEALQGMQFDLVWLDYASSGHELEIWFKRFWPLINPAGGVVIVHSAVTNHDTRGWLERMKKRARLNVADSASGHPDGSSSWLQGLTVMSWLEPHKTFQNACTMFQKRLAEHPEPIYSKGP